MEKRDRVLVFAVVLAGVAVFLLSLFYDVGKTFGTLKLYVDGEEINVDWTSVEFSFTDGDKFNKSVKLKNSSFSFNKSEYAMYHIRFTLDPNLWGDTGEAIQFEARYLCTYNKAITEYELQVNVESEEVKTIELIAGVIDYGSVKSGKIPIKRSGMAISVRIPSP